MTEVEAKKPKNVRIETEEAIIAAIDTWNKGAYGYGISYREVAASTGLALGTVHRICKVLREEGRITAVDHVSRSLRVTGGSNG